MGTSTGLSKFPDSRIQVLIICGISLILATLVIGIFMQLVLHVEITKEALDNMGIPSPYPLR